MTMCEWEKIGIERRELVMKRKIQMIVFVLCIAVFVLSAWKLYGIQSNYKEGDELYASVEEEVITVLSDEEEESEVEENTKNGENKKKKKNKKKKTPMISVDFATLKKKNPDIIAWLYIPYSDISYPLLQGSDNETYLHKAYDGQSSIFGSIFMDFRNHPDFSDQHTIIYGHNMKNGSMFGTLKQYCDASFYKKNKNFYVLTEDGTYQYRVFSYHVADALGKVYTVFYEDEDAFQSYLNLVVQSSYLDTGVDVSTDDKVITLSTCTGDDDSRFVVHGVRVKE